MLSTAAPSSASLAHLVSHRSVTKRKDSACNDVIARHSEGNQLHATCCKHPGI